MMIARTARLKTAWLLMIAAALTLILVAALPALASSTDVIRRGSCSARSDWKLKLSPDDGRIEVQFEVDSNVVGQTWRVRISENGSLIFSGNRVTRAPSGSFEVRRLAVDTAGTDSFRARASNPATGETCLGRASI